MDYFTKWIEAKPLASITSNNIQKFFWQNIICRFRVPRELTVDNGKQFDCNEFREFCLTMGMKIKFASVYHPQSNGAMERANGLIFSGIKKCLFNQKKGKWVDELPRVIWAHNTTASRAIGFSPFRLLFGSEAMTPKEIKNESLRVIKTQANNEADELDKDLIEINVLEAVKNLDKYQQETRKWRDRKIIRKEIQEGDLVIKKKKNWENPRKLQEAWEGPYIVTKNLRPGSSHLANQLGNELPYTWNADNLRKYYP